MTAPAASVPVSELMAQLADVDRAVITAYREAAADLCVLETYDGLRRSKGHDYGNGQRANELNRRLSDVQERRARVRLVLNTEARTAALELTSSIGIAAPEKFTGDELRGAVARILEPRLARTNREGYRVGTEGSGRTIEALEAAIRILRMVAIQRDAGR